MLDPFGRLAAPSGLVLSGSGNLTLSWDVYPGALCFNIYQASDPNNPEGEYVIIAECVEGNSFQLPGPGSYRVSAITPEGESELSDSVRVEGPAPPPTSIWEGLISYWAWENNLVDSTGNGHTLYELPPVAFDTGKVNVGGQTFASGDGRYGQDDAVYDFSGAASSVFTFVGWFNPSEIGHYTNVFQYGNWGVAFDDFVMKASIKDDGTYGGGTTELVAGIDPPQAGVWYFVVFHYNGVTKNGYLELNRAGRVSTPGPVNLEAAPGSLGFLGNHVGAFSPGAFALTDEYGFWPRELSTTELDYLYNSGIGKTFNT